MAGFELAEVGLTSASEKLFSNRANFSLGRLQSLEGSLRASKSIAEIPTMSIFTAGSYGRLEASEHSDIDLFFVTTMDAKSAANQNISSISMFADVVDIGKRLTFPPFSNDGEYLKLLRADDIQSNLGSRVDDFHNHFTARMLLILEGRPLYGNEDFNEFLKSIVGSYFRDYDHHPNDFRPTFLVNDIVRFWKTLCLNYEHGRNQVEHREKIKQKIRNFKLKYSRMLTCFASIALFSAHQNKITPEIVVDVCGMTPAQRFRSLAEFDANLKPKIARSLESYAWFMDLTGLSKEKLEEHFSDKSKRAEAFERAENFGNLVFDVLLDVSEKKNSLRYLVV